MNFLFDLSKEKAARTKVRKVFDEMSKGNVVGWTTMIMRALGLD